VDFEGAAGALTFLSSPPGSSRPAPLMRYRLEVTTGGELLLSSLSDVAAQGAATSRQPLLTGVRQLDLAYFGAADPDQTRRWRSSWQDQPKPPELVRVRVVFEPGDRRWWPDLIVKPQVTIDTACVLEPTGHGCRGRA
jgi:general secretion pathway protein J